MALGRLPAMCAYTSARRQTDRTRQGMKATGCKQSTQAWRQAARANQIKTSNQDAQQHRQNVLVVRGSSGLEILMSASLN